jgi:hypothetical protein
VKPGAVLVLLVMLTAGVPRLFDPETWLLLDAVRDLGAISGWRCVHSTYVYDPNHEQPDSVLLVDRPEAVVLDQIPGVAVDTVAVDLHGGEALLSAHGLGPVLRDERLVYVLSPGRFRSLTVEEGTARTTICNAALGDWKIVGEQNLG